MTPDLSVAQAAERLGVSLDLVRARIADGSLVAYSIGSPGAARPTYRVPPMELVRFRQRQQPAPPDHPQPPRRRRRRRKPKGKFY